MTRCLIRMIRQFFKGGPRQEGAPADSTGVRRETTGKAHSTDAAENVNIDEPVRDPRKSDEPGTRQNSTCRYSISLDSDSTDVQGEVEHPLPKGVENVVLRPRLHSLGAGGKGQRHSGSEIESIGTEPSS